MSTNEVTLCITSFDGTGSPVRIFWEPPKKDKGGSWKCYRLKYDNAGNESYAQRCPTPGRIMEQRLRDDVERIRSEAKAKNKKKIRTLKVTNAV